MRTSSVRPETCSVPDVCDNVSSSARVAAGERESRAQPDSRTNRPTRSALLTPFGVMSRLRPRGPDFGAVMS